MIIPSTIGVSKMRSAIEFVIEGIGFMLCCATIFGLYIIF
jgi:hypothetical protein